MKGEFNGEKVIDNNSATSSFFPDKCKSVLYDFYPDQGPVAPLIFSLLSLRAIASCPQKSGNLHWCKNCEIQASCILAHLLSPVQSSLGVIRKKKKITIIYK